MYLMKGFIGTIFFISLLATLSFAQDYYVIQEDAGTNAGTQANPWQGWTSIDWDTDGAGADTGVGAGDTLYIVGTVKGESFYVPGYGLADDNRMTLTSDLSTPGKMLQGREIDDTSWTGPDAYGTYSKAAEASASYYYANEWTTDAFDSTKLVTETKIPDGTWAAGSFYNPGAGTIYYKPTDGTLVGKTLTSFAGTSRVFVFTNQDYITISNLILNNPILISSGADYITIDSNEIFTSGTQYAAIQVNGLDNPGCDYGIIKANYIHDAINGIYIYNQAYDDTRNNDYWTIENNYIKDIHGDSDAHGIGLQGGIGAVIQNNYIYNCGSGITFWSQATQTMQNNIVRFNYIGHMGYYYADGDGENGRGIEFSGEQNDSDLITGNVIYGNVVTDCLYVAADPDGIGIRIKSGIPTTGYAVKVFNNTVDDCYYNYWIQPSNNDATKLGAYLWNNISLTPKSGGSHIYAMVPATVDLSIDKNIFYPDGSFYYGGANADLAAWKTATPTGVDTNSVTSDPGLTDYIPDAASGVVYDGEVLTLGYDYILNPTTTWPTTTPDSGDVDIIEQGTFFNSWFIGAFSSEIGGPIRASGRFNFGN